MIAIVAAAAVLAADVLAIVNGQPITRAELERALASRVAPVTRSDLDFIKAYEAGKQEAAITIPPGEGRLAAAIHGARFEQLRLAVIDSVRRHASVETRLAPPRVSVPTGSAPV